MPLLDGLTIKAKLSLLVALAALSLMLASGLAATTLHEKMIDERVSKLRNLVEIAHGLAQALDQRVAAHQITREEAIDLFRTDIHEMWYDDHKNYFVVYTMDAICVANAVSPKSEGTNALGTGNSIVKSMIDLMRRQTAGTIAYTFPKPGGSEPLPKISYLMRFEPWNAFIFTGVYIDDIEADFQAQLIRLGLVTLTLVAATAGAVWLISRNITKPLHSLQTQMGRLADNDLTVELREIGRRDEIGSMARAVGVFKESMAEADRLRADQDAQQQRRIGRAEWIEASITGFELAIGAVVGSIGMAAANLQLTAEAMAENSAQTSRQSTAVAASSEQASQNVQAVASATEELSASIGEIGQQVAHSTTIIAGAVQQASGSNEQVQGLAAAAERIGDVVNLIKNIAGQTNLLALNATIEAARAGDSGKGFAVVASEVKALANQTARATEDITAQVNAIQEATQSSAQSIQGVMQTITQVSATTAAVAAAVEQQSVATREIARNVHQAFQGTAEVSSTIADVSEAAQHVGTNADQVLASAAALSRNGELLKSQVGDFLQKVRVG